MTAQQTYDDVFFQKGPLGFETPRFIKYREDGQGGTRPVEVASPFGGGGGLGFLQEYVRGGQSYEQAGTDIPDYGVAQKYEQERGGPLVSRTIRYSPPNAILKSPHMDSPYMDQLIERGFKPLMPPKPTRPKGPQLPSFV